VAVELVRHSVHSCGVLDTNVRVQDLEELNIICVRLLGFEETIGIEVWDNAPAPATLPEPRYDSELEGLALVNARARCWGSSLVPPNRVVWAEVDVYDRSGPGPNP
ncbi:MAG TPA: hypothetical protein VFO68_18505, partial [Actinophytocola sp.]|nr:hypothetical protein [Actinophytocola sp.]